MKKNVLTLLQSAIIPLARGVAEQLRGQPVNEVFDSEYRKRTAAVTLDYSLSADDSFLFTENMVTAHPWHAA